MGNATWAALRRTLTRFDRDKIHPGIAIRNTIGVVLPLIVAEAAGQHALGLVGSLGALNVAYQDGTDGYAFRARRMLMASVLVALALFTGGLTGHHNGFAIIVAAGAAFLAGMLVCLGSAAGDIGTITLVTLVVFASRPLTPRQAAISGLVALAGALLQTCLALLLWPIRRGEKERGVLAQTYSELAELAELRLKPGAAPLGTAAFTRAQDSLIGMERSGAGERIRSLLSQAERIRLRVLALGRLRRRLHRDPCGAFATGVVDRFIRACSGELSGISAALRSRSQAETPTAQFTSDAEALMRELRGYDCAGASPFFVAVVRDALTQMDALAGQIRAAWRMTVLQETAPPPVPGRNRSRAIGLARARNQFAIVRANLTMRSGAFRHALRLAACVAIGDAIGRSVDWRRSYWIPMTIAIVLKPDFITTFSRGVLRLAGTFIGLIVATVLYFVLPASTLTDVIFVGSFTLLLRWAGPANYGLFSIAVSGLVVALIANSGTAPREVIPLRALNTAIGGALALLAYALWPTWERTQSGESFARLLDAYRAYLRAVRDTYITGSVSDFSAVDRARQAARVARSNVEGSAERLGMEPGASAELLAQVASMLASSHDFIYAVMTIEGAATDRAEGNGAAAGSGALARFLDQVELTLYQLAAAFRGSPTEPGHFPDLRAQHRLLTGGSGAGRPDYSLIEVETDRMTNALNTLREQSLEWLQRTSRSPVTAGLQAAVSTTAPDKL
jgi:uncharacterized membrane protein YccC